MAVAVNFYIFIIIFQIARHHLTFGKLPSVQFCHTLQFFDSDIQVCCYDFNQLSNEGIQNQGRPLSGQSVPLWAESEGKPQIMRLLGKTLFPSLLSPVCAASAGDQMCCVTLYSSQVSLKLNIHCLTSHSLLGILSKKIYMFKPCSEVLEGLQDVIFNQAPVPYSILWECII